MPLISKVPSEAPIGFSISSLQRPFHLFAYSEAVKIDFMYVFSAISIIPIRPIFVQWDQIYVRNSSSEALKKLEKKKVVEIVTANNIQPEIESKSNTEEKISCYKRKTRKKNKEEKMQTQCVNVKSIKQTVVISPEEPKQNKITSTIQIPIIIKHKARALTVNKQIKSNELIMDSPLNNQRTTIIAPSNIETRTEDNIEKSLGSRFLHHSTKGGRPKRMFKKNLIVKTEALTKSEVVSEEGTKKEEFEETWWFS